MSILPFNTVTTFQLLYCREVGMEYYRQLRDKIKGLKLFESTSTDLKNRKDSPRSNMDPTTEPQKHNCQLGEENLIIQALFSSRQFHFPLPYELTTAIIDYAERWLCTTLTSILPQLKVTAVSDGDMLLLASEPLSRRDITNMRKLVFFLRSRDQRWSDQSERRGTYDGSWTWFDVVLQKPNSSLTVGGKVKNADEELKTRLCLQRNRHAGTEFEEYRIELKGWSGCKLFHEMVKGDRIALMMSARFPGWQNNVNYARMDIYTMDDLGDKIE